MYNNNTELPKSIRNLPQDAQTIWRNSHTADWVRNQNNGLSDVSILEASASKAAWQAVNKYYYMDDTDNWKKKHDYKQVKQGITKLDEDYYSIGSFPIFKAGRWNDMDFSTSDLISMIEFSEIPIPLGVGHKGQWLLSQLDLPNAGIATKLYLDKNKQTLFADIIYIPKSIYELLKNNRLSGVSVILSSVRANGIDTGYKIVSIDLLGQDVPAVKNLGTLQELYDINNYTKQFNQLFEVAGGFSMNEISKKLNFQEEAPPAPPAPPEGEEQKAETTLETLSAQIADHEQRIKKLEDAIGEIVSMLTGESSESPAEAPADASSMSEKKIFDNYINQRIDKCNISKELRDLTKKLNFSQKLEFLKQFENASIDLDSKKALLKQRLNFSENKETPSEKPSEDKTKPLSNLKKFALEEASKRK